MSINGKRKKNPERIKFMKENSCWESITAEETQDYNSQETNGCRTETIKNKRNKKPILCAWKWNQKITEITSGQKNDLPREIAAWIWNGQQKEHKIRKLRKESSVNTRLIHPKLAPLNNQGNASSWWVRLKNKKNKGWADMNDELQLAASINSKMKG